MGEHVIIEKLINELAEPIVSERQVVYILVESRKLIELKGELAKYHALDFYSSWVLHTNMDRAGAIRILERFDKAHPLLNNRDISDLPKDLYNEISETLGMEMFRVQLQEFLGQYGLSENIVKQDWTSFLRLYASVIDNCPLIVKGENPKLKNINRVDINLDEAPEKLLEADKEFLVYRIRWTCHGKDGKTGEISTYFTIP